MTVKRSRLFLYLFLAPDESPSGVSVESTSNPGELSLTWLPPPAHTINGILLGYIIRAVPQIDDKSGKKLYYTHHRTYLIQNRKRFTQYRLFASSLNDIQTF